MSKAIGVRSVKELIDDFIGRTGMKTQTELARRMQAIDGLTNERSIERAIAALKNGRQPMTQPLVTTMCAVFQNVGIPLEEIRELEDAANFISVIRKKISPDDKETIDWGMVPDFSFYHLDYWRNHVNTDLEKYSNKIMFPTLSHANMWYGSPQDKLRLAGMFVLAWTIATSDDRRIANRIIGLLYDVLEIFGECATIHSFVDYAMIRTYYEGLAQAEGRKKDNDRCVRFVEQHCTDKGVINTWEAQMFQYYYNDHEGQPVTTSIAKKLQSPLERNKNMRPLQECLFEHLPKPLQIKTERLLASSVH